MKLAITSAVILALIVGVAALRARAKEKRSPADVMAGLRNQALTATPSELGIHTAAGRPFGIIMDSGTPQAVISVVAWESGEASIYFSTGGGMLGGGGHENVRKAAKAFVTEAAAHLARFHPTREFPCPPPGVVRFYVRTPEGVLLAEAPEAAFGEGKNDELTKLYASGQDVITQFRLVTEGMQRVRPD